MGRNLSNYWVTRLAVMEYFCEQSEPKTLLELAWYLKKRYGIYHKHDINLRYIIGMLVKDGFLQRVGRTRGTRYVISESAKSKCEEVKNTLSREIPHICSKECRDAVEMVETLEKRLFELYKAIGGLVILLEQSLYTARKIEQMASV